MTKSQSPHPVAAPTAALSVPSLVSLTPNQGSGSGGTTVTISGGALTGATAVKFGTANAASYSVLSDTVISAVSPAGTGTVQVTVTTAGGTSNGLPYTYAALPAPSLVSLTPNQGSGSGGTTVTISGGALTGATAVKFGTANAASYSVLSSTVISAVSPAGTGTVQVTVTTAGGTSNGLPYTYAALPAPSLVSLTPNQGSGSGGTTVTISGGALTGATAVKFGTANAASYSVLSDTVISAVSPAGTGTVQVTVTTAGGTSNGLPYTYVAVPTLTSVTPGQGPSAGGATVTLAGANLSGATSVKFGGTAATSFTVVSASQITATAPPGSAGPVLVTVTTPGGTSNSVPYFYLSAPVLTSLSPDQGPVSGGTTVTLTGANLLGASAVSFGGTPATSFTVVSATQITATAPAGTGTAQVTATTAGGTSNALPYGYVAAPTLTGLVPSQGPVSGGTTVTLTGTNLTSTTGVVFGTTSAAFTVVSATQIAVTAPAGTGTVQVTVTTAGGTSNGLPYTYVAVPTLTSVTPGQGPSAGGTTVTLAGANLSGATSVKFGGTAATSFTVVSASQITATAPPGSAGPVLVTVTTPGGTSNSVPYFYLSAPVLTSLSPDQGPVSGGTTVTLTGANLLGASAVSFGGTPATSFTVVSATQITATAPAGTGTAQVTATTAGGTSNALPYGYVAAPTLTGLVPSQGPVSGGTTVTLTGTNLTSTTGVVFGTTPVAFTVVSSTQVTAGAPPGSAGPVSVTVTTAGGTSNSLTYTRVEPPSI
ncbi:beta strand repeat-containing protein [Kitasatospora sp. NBC_00085]|uniref:beta strand repeat-containing protein n=1 Tax=Kitasatospora sp. NBC_00085 TaxID=2903566 RepID=UPI00386924E8